MPDCRSWAPHHGKCNVNCVILLWFSFAWSRKSFTSRKTVSFFSVWWQRSSHGSWAAPQLGVAESVWDARDGWWAFIFGNHVQSSQFEPQQYQALTNNIRKTQGEWSLMTVWLALMFLANRTVLMAKSSPFIWLEKSKKREEIAEALNRLEGWYRFSRQNAGCQSNWSYSISLWLLWFCVA